MSPDTERLVRESWELLRPMSDELASSFYARLFESNPSLSALFDSTNMQEQRRKFVVMLAEIVRVLDQPQLLVGEVAASGRRHVSYGVRRRDYEDVGAALLFAIGGGLGDRFTPEMQSAWREAYELLAAVMRRAAESNQIA
jgi:hemoglobin-like flavoprotein